MENNHQAKHSRRSLILKAGASAVCVLASSGAVFANKAEQLANFGKGGERTDDWLAQMDENFARAYIGTDFEFVSEIGRARAVLRSVDTVERRTKRADLISVRAFSLRFEIMESTRTTPEGYCNVVHPALGTFSLMVVPGTSGKGERSLLATFARL